MLEGGHRIVIHRAAARLCIAVTFAAGIAVGFAIAALVFVNS